MYQVEDKEARELFTIKVRDGVIIRYKHIWAYSLEEAQSKVELDGDMELVD